ncbi:MAG: DUF2868 domain-containing protein [Acidiferrobacterales bacterium]|nr:DUF2868 domain-containing protein [Acidiferrobacterales bacterium]
MQKLSPLGDLIDIKAQIDRDRQLERTLLRERDRAIGLEQNHLAKTSDNNLKRLRAWISTIREEGEIVSPGQNVDKAMRNAILISWVLGATIGYLLARSVLAYDGSQPVNLLIALIVLIGVQLVALLILFLLLLFRRDKLLDAVSILNPTNIILLVLGRMQPSWKKAITTYSTGLSPRRGIGFLPQMLAYLSQHFSIALNIGILGTLLYLVTISDLAFGWNTTLDIQTDTINHFFQSLALPWQSIVPSAVPDYSLVESSRYYRLQSQLRSGGWEANKLGTWWLYLALCLVFYGFLPRLIALVVTGIQYDRAIVRATLALPGTSQILARMSDPLVSTESQQKETEAEIKRTRPGLLGRQAARDIDCLVIEWSDCSPPDADLISVGVQSISRLTAGGRQSPAEDRDTITAAKQVQCEGVVITLKSWEPPLLEVTDFIALLRKNIPATLPIIVLLQPLPDQSVSPAQIETWETALGVLSDSALYLESI